MTQRRAGGTGPGPDAGAPPLPERVLVTWEGGKRYRGGRDSAPPIVLDGDREAGPGAVDAVAIALAACSAQDVENILRKRRTPAESLEVEVRFARAPEPPRRILGMRLVYRVRTSSAVHHVERAVALALEKYCSVSASLAPDVRVTTTVEMAPPAEAGSPEAGSPGAGSPGSAGSPPVTEPPMDVETP